MSGNVCKPARRLMLIMAANLKLFKKDQLFPVCVFVCLNDIIFRW